jgi:hypothetical protein
MSNSLDSQQVTLAITKAPFVLNELKRKQRLVTNPAGDTVFRIQFDSHTFEFRVPTKEKPGNTITFGKTVAERLIEDSYVIVGPSIDGQVYPVLEVVREFDLSLGEKENPNTCSYCGANRKPFANARELADHIIEEHAIPDEDKSPKRKESVANAGA